MKLRTLVRFSLLAVLVLNAAALAAAPMRIEVDARELPRKLLHAKIELPASPGPAALWYPKWVPGIHAPGGPIQNMAGLEIQSPDGRRISWRRDETEAYRIQFTIPEGLSNIVVKVDYICGQPTVNSMGVDSYGNSRLGVINWNTCLVYPEGISVDDLLVEAELRLPPGWEFATALGKKESRAGTIQFKPEVLRHFIDCPVICGEHLRTWDLKPATLPPTFLHIVSESPAALQLEDRVIGLYRNVANEAGAIFGGGHFPAYLFLVTCSDDLGYNGVVHLTSSFYGVRERDLIDDRKRKGWVANLLPHEFVHSWCGKHRRPAGMISPNFHEPEKTSLLWVYEGLAEYLGELLITRSGLITPDEYRADLAATIRDLLHTTGRHWRPLEDTAIASHLLRGRSASWQSLRRSQDYYHEGMLLWLEADAVIRERSQGRRSLDDFCLKFMGPGRSEKIVPYDRAEVIQTLNDVEPYDWAAFLRERVDEPHDAMPLTVVERCGYRLHYSSNASAHLQEMEREREFVSAVDSIGLSFSSSGSVQTVVPGMAGDKAGFAPGMNVQGVNGRKFTTQRLKDAIADSVTKREIEFLVLDGDTFRTLKAAYSDGSKYLELVRNPDRPDLLSEIVKPRFQGNR
jgi:predicted metalloprotease with PDZ domain